MKQHPRQNRRPFRGNDGQPRQEPARGAPNGGDQRQRQAPNAQQGGDFRWQNNQNGQSGNRQPQNFNGARGRDAQRPNVETADRNRQPQPPQYRQPNYRRGAPAPRQTGWLHIRPWSPAMSAPLRGQEFWDDEDEEQDVQPRRQPPAENRPADARAQRPPPQRDAVPSAQVQPVAPPFEAVAAGDVVDDVAALEMTPGDAPAVAQPPTLADAGEPRGPRNRRRGAPSPAPDRDGSVDAAAPADQSEDRPAAIETVHLNGVSGHREPQRAPQVVEPAARPETVAEPDASPAREPGVAAVPSVPAAPAAADGGDSVRSVSAAVAAALARRRGRTGNRSAAEQPTAVQPVSGDPPLIVAADDIVTEGAEPTSSAEPEAKENAAPEAAAVGLALPVPAAGDGTPAPVSDRPVAAESAGASARSARRTRKPAAGDTGGLPTGPADSAAAVADSPDLPGGPADSDGRAEAVAVADPLPAAPGQSSEPSLEPDAPVSSGGVAVGTKAPRRARPVKAAAPVGDVVAEAEAAAAGAESAPATAKRTTRRRPTAAESAEQPALLTPEPQAASV